LCLDANLPLGYQRNVRLCVQQRPMNKVVAVAIVADDRVLVALDP
jgi:hypothetical protein